jgi:hypothetical protein
MKSCNSFLVRHWLIDDEPESQRQFFDIEHIKSGEHFRVTSLYEAETWMVRNLRTQPGDDDSEPQRLIADDFSR